MDNTIAAHWKEFADKVLPATAGPGQRHDMRVGFYAGALSLFAIIGLEAEADPNGERVSESMGKLKNEVQEFFAMGGELETGGAKDE